MRGELLQAHTNQYYKVASGNKNKQYASPQRAQQHAGHNFKLYSPPKLETSISATQINEMTRRSSQLSNGQKMSEKKQSDVFIISNENTIENPVLHRKMRESFASRNSQCSRVSI